MDSWGFILLSEQIWTGFILLFQFRSYCTISTLILLQFWPLLRCISFEIPKIWYGNHTRGFSWISVTKFCYLMDNISLWGLYYACSEFSLTSSVVSLRLSYPSRSRFTFSLVLEELTQVLCCCSHGLISSPRKPMDPSQNNVFKHIKYIILHRKPIILKSYYQNIKAILY